LENGEDIKMAPTGGVHDEIYRRLNLLEDENKKLKEEVAELKKEVGTMQAEFVELHARAL